ncbi:hypothetical protein ACP70R_009126 [Stipagrostis hirtigluma subsp. patula]
MAELVSGAVTTLLGVIRKETERLGRVRGDVQFIQEEMESMNSFLVHLARTRREEQDEQVRTWMNQVRILANDCNNCLDVYLYRRNPDFHRPKGRLSRCLWWGWGGPYWWVHMMLAQSRAAEQLRELKERARDVGERRLRYSVKLKVPLPEGQSSPPGSASGVAEDDDEDYHDDEDEPHAHQHKMVEATKSSVQGYFKERIVSWVQQLRTTKAEGELRPGEREVQLEAEEPLPPMPCIAFVLPDTEEGRARASAFARDDALAQAQHHFSRSVLVDISAVHLDTQDYSAVPPLRPKDILYYILREIIDPTDHQSQGQPGPGVNVPWRKTKWGIFYAKKKLLRQIKQQIQAMEVDDKIEGIEGIKNIEVSGDQQLPGSEKDEMELEDEIKKDSLPQLLQLLITSTAPVPEQDQARKKSMRTLSALYDVIIQTTAARLHEHMGSTDSQQQHFPLSLSSDEYAAILRQVFPRTTPIGPDTSASTSVEYEIKEMVNMVKDMVLKLQDYDRSDKNQEASGPTQNRDAVLKEAARKKMEDIKRRITEQLTIKGIVDKIINHFTVEGSSKNSLAGSSSKNNSQAESSSENNLDAERILIILKTDLKHVSKWEETRKLLSLLETSRWFAGAAIVITTNQKSTRQFKEYFSDPDPEVIEYSAVGHYLDDIVSKLPGKKMKEDKHNIVRSILEDCEPHGSCMEIFAYALKANPKRSTQELHQLHNILQARPASGFYIARKILKFSYSDLPKQYKSCLLYLAIFPPVKAPPPPPASAPAPAVTPVPKHEIKRSTLIGRWVAEGLITTDDWCWSSSVDEAEKCFQSLIDRKLVLPAGFGTTGKVKTCMVDPLVHGFITKIAQKQHIVEARLSHKLARHFSIFNDVRLRNTDTIEIFLTRNIHDLAQISKLKVLDLEDCHSFASNKGSLKDICNKILMLKYLSLRRTDVNNLPHAINNLHELEVLDIRETNIPASATREVLLLKLKRLQAGRITDPCSSSTDTRKPEDFSSVQIPKLIENMSEVEVLSNVKPKTSRDLEDIGFLSQLKKLGVVIDKVDHIPYLLRGIYNLRQHLRSLSITLNKPIVDFKLIPNNLRSLSISGSKLNLGLFVTENSQLAKLTLSNTSLEKEDLELLAKFQNLHCVRLRHVSCTDTQLTFEEGDFPKLKLLTVDSSEITKISFTGGCPELEKIVWSFTRMESLSGIDKLPVLKELELIGDNVPSNVEQEISSKHGLVYKPMKPENQDQATRNAEHGAGPQSSRKAKGLCWRN